MQRIDSLEIGKKYRLIWIGAFYEEKDSGEKFIDICLMEISNYNEFFTDYKNGTVEKNKSNFKGRHVLFKANITRLPGLALGSIFQNEKTINFQDDYSRYRGKFSINPQNGREENLFEIIGHSSINDNKVSELNSKVWAFTNLNGFYLNNETNEPWPVKLLLIPTYEIIRFYYANDSNLAYALFNAGLVTKEIVYQKSWTNEEKAKGKNPFLVLGKRMKDRHADIIGRMVFVDEAFRNAKKIHDSLLEESPFKFPSSGFPFTETTELLFNYINYEIKDFEHIKNKFPELKKDDKIVIVNQILSCSQPFQFNKIDFLRENDARTIEKNQEAKLRNRNSKKNVGIGSNPDTNPLEGNDKNPDENPDSEISERDPNEEAVIDGKVLKIEPYPNRPKTNKLEKTEQKTITRYLQIKKRADGKTRGRQPGAGGNGGVDSLLIHGPEDSQTEKSFLLFINFLKEKYFKCELLNLNKGQINHSFFPADSLRGRTGYFWCFLYYHLSFRDWPLRKCWIAKLSHKDYGTFYLIEIQRRLANPNLSKEIEANNLKENRTTEAFVLYILSSKIYKKINGHQENKKELKDKELEDYEENLLDNFLLKLATHRGVLTAMLKEEAFEFSGLRHQKNETPDKLLKRIQNKLDLFS
jgi:hypothetical protein